jgi:prepilin-type N-terminal cleavage/methylation domain-containing protein
MDRGPGSEREAGFTLIELLVVIIIIGILASIAIPVFLNQRHKAYDSAAKSDLRNVAQFEEGYLVDHPSYGTVPELIAAGDTPKVSPGDTVNILFATSLGYCLTAQHSGSDTIWYYDNQAGGVQPKGSTGCPVTTTGASGGSLTG